MPNRSAFACEKAELAVWAMMPPVAACSLNWFAGAGAQKQGPTLIADQLKAGVDLYARFFQRRKGLANRIGHGGIIIGNNGRGLSTSIGAPGVARVAPVLIEQVQGAVTGVEIRCECRHGLNVGNDLGRIHLRGGRLRRLGRWRFARRPVCRGRVCCGRDVWVGSRLHGYIDGVLGAGDCGGKIRDASQNFID